MATSEADRDLYAISLLVTFDMFNNVTMPYASRPSPATVSYSW
jgi:hypothetical protein